jgi:tetratricopeptide (TPR) repeat protein
MQVRGAWREALEEARRASARVADARAVGLALYRQGELHRLQGEFADAEQAYRDANRHGLEPQPGMALLRLAQGGTAAAVAVMRRVMAETGDPLRRSALLPACVDIMLAAGEVEAAADACGELAALAERLPGDELTAAYEQAAGAVRLAQGDPRSALTALRAAADGWRALDAPYEGARVRELVGLACRALGDEDSAAMELEAAREGT